MAGRDNGQVIEGIPISSITVYEPTGVQGAVIEAMNKAATGEAVEASNILYKQHKLDLKAAVEDGTATWFSAMNDVGAIFQQGERLNDSITLAAGRAEMQKLMSNHDQTPATEDQAKEAHRDQPN